MSSLNSDKRSSFYSRNITPRYTLAISVGAAPDPGDEPHPRDVWYLNQLPDEILSIICDYVISETNTHLASATPAVSLSMGSLHNVWPHSRYDIFTKPYIHHLICFNGSALNLKQIMDEFLHDPDTRLWARVLLFTYMGSVIDELQPFEPFEPFEEECEWMADACTKLGLKVEGMELPVMSQDGMAEEFRPGLDWSRSRAYKRLEFFAHILHKVTRFCYYTNADWIWPFPTLHKRHLHTRALPAVALESQSEENNIIMSEPACTTIATPVPSGLRSLDQYYMGHDFWYSECRTPCQSLLPAFFLPNIRGIECSKIYMLDEDLTALGPDAPHPHTSPVTTLHLILTDMHLETFEKFLRLPKALVEYSYRNTKYPFMHVNGFTMSDMVHVLSKYHSKSLETLTLDASETREGNYIAPTRISSLRQFVKLRVIEAPYWSLVNSPDGSYRRSQAHSTRGPSTIPRDTEVVC